MSGWRLTASQMNKLRPVFSVSMTIWCVKKKKKTHFCLWEGQMIKSRKEIQPTEKYITTLFWEQIQGSVHGLFVKRRMSELIKMRYCIDNGSYNSSNFIISDLKSVVQRWMKIVPKWLSHELLRFSWKSFFSKKKKLFLSKVTNQETSDPACISSDTPKSNNG